MSRRAWTADEDALLRRLRGEDASMEEIAAAVGRTANAVHHRRLRLGLEPGRRGKAKRATGKQIAAALDALASGASVREAARLTDLAPSTVRYHAETHGVSARGYSGEAWTDGEVEALAWMRAEGWQIKDCAEALERPLTAVRSRARRQDVTTLARRFREHPPLDLLGDVVEPKRAPAQVVAPIEPTPTPEPLVEVVTIEPAPIDAEAEVVAPEPAPEPCTTTVQTVCYPARAAWCGPCQTLTRQERARTLSLDDAASMSGQLRTVLASWIDAGLLDAEQDDEGQWRVHARALADAMDAARGRERRPTASTSAAPTTPSEHATELPPVDWMMSGRQLCARWRMSPALVRAALAHHDVPLVERDGQIYVPVEVARTMGPSGRNKHHQRAGAESEMSEARDAWLMAVARHWTEAQITAVAGLTQRLLRQQARRLGLDLSAAPLGADDAL